jgi:hypothetical protein
MLAALYRPLVFVHVLAAFLYMFAHGASGLAAYRMRSETLLERIRALLDLSAYSFTLMYVSLLVMVLAGVALGFLGHWWGAGWIWAALITLVVMLVVMGILASGHFHRLRKAVGLPYREGNKEHPAIDPAPEAEIRALLTSGRPHLLALVGIGGWALILYFMVFKPF